MRRRLISGLFVVLVLLNTMGYLVIITGFQLKNDAMASQALDDDEYNEAQAITLRLPIALPYQYDNADFMRVEGKFLHNGESYRLIKQKYANDTLTVICIKDEADRQIQDALADVVSTYVDATNDTKTPTKSESAFIKEYIGGVCTLLSCTSGWAMDIISHPSIQLHEDVYLPHTPRPPKA